ncbi:MAG: C40 family peptidase [Clostridia bacterium]|nr:C40 family peptidase [Clostridia bacterium]
MKRMGIVCLCAVLLCGCAGTGQSDPIRQVTVVTSEPTAAPTAAPTATATPEPLTIAVLPAATERATAIPTPTATPTPTLAPTAVPTLAPTSAPTAAPASETDDAERFLAAALAMEGKPYLRSGTTEEGFDPGGFVYYCLKTVGVKVSHRSSKGYAEQENWTKIDDLDAIEPGDLLFFRTGDNESVNCVCIYLGDGKMIYPSSGKGEVIVTKLHTNYWESAFVLARRVF